MEKYFKNSKVLHGDCFVADYTNESNSKRGGGDVRCTF